MSQSDIMKKVIGILTEAQGIRRAVEAGEDDGSPDRGEPSVVNLLLSEMLPSFSVPEDATPAEVAKAVGEELAPRLKQMVGAFAVAFSTLASVHDSGQSDESSVDVLRGLALRVEAGDFDE